MRTIKFRSWCTLKEAFVFVSLNEHGSFEWDSLYPHEATLQQFTGLHDKNGKEIFEGDILSSEYPREGSKNCHPVVWGEGRACWVVDHSINDCCRLWKGDLGGHHMSEEIIGNIYENPELLTPNE